MRNKALGIVFCCALQSIVLAQAVSDSIAPKSEYKLALTEIAGGLDLRSNFFKPNTGATEYRYSGFYGAVSRVQTSFLGLLVADKWFKKFLIADYEAGEVMAGYAYSQIPNVPSGFLALYNFELGGLIRYQASSKLDLWFNVTLLQFARDYFSDFFGGSNYRLRMRYHRWVYEASWISENKFYFGAFNFITRDNNISKVMIGFKHYIKPNHFIGAQLLALPATSNYEWQLGSERVITTQVLYGINF